MSDNANRPSDQTADASPHRPGVTPFRAGTVLALVGALLLGVGLLGTTTASNQPDCPEGTVLLAKFEVSGNKYTFEEPKGNESVVSVTGDITSGTWTSSQPVAAILVKGGPGSAATTYTPPTTSGTFSNADLEPNNGGQPDISNLQFCTPDGSVTTTTAPPTTDTTVPPTTETTVPPTTETTVPPTTETTVPPTTETTVPPTTETTVPPTTETTVPPTTETTVPPTTETTVLPTTTEVTPTTEGPTTTEAPTTTEPPAEVEPNVIVTTEVTPNDAVVQGSSLAFTGGSSLPLVLMGMALLFGGATMALVSRQRQRRAGA
jgi:hypothetical protein